MRSKKTSNTILWTVVLAALFVTTGVAVAQEPPPPPQGGMPIGGPGPGPGPGPMGGEFGDGNAVKGAPLSADLVVIRENTLADGNKIHNESTTKVYRDAEGRVRREMAVDLPMPMANSARRNLIVINDPVAGTRYVLNPATKTARQMPLHRSRRSAGGKGPGPIGPGEPGGPGDAKEVTKEQLGTKTVNGMQAEGVRVTRTIPAGAMGNEKAITVVTERWYSPDLQMVVMTMHSDPMMGTITTNLTNIKQGAPDSSLFQVPADYTVKTGKDGDPMFMPMKP